MPVFEIRYAPHVWRLLNGVFCVYKPKAVSFRSLRTKLLSKLTNDLNDMECRPPRDIVHISGQLSSGEPLKVETKESFADNPLVVGKRYQPQDFAVTVVNYTGFYCSGVSVVFIGKMAKNAGDFRKSQHLRTYEIKCQLGFATNNFRADGRIVEKSRCKHVTAGHIGRVISKTQALHQTLMFKTLGVDLRSEEAYELASKGMVRPTLKRTTPVIYKIRLTEFSSPDFTLEIECMDEFEDYLYSLVHNIGLKLKTNAMVTGMRLKRFGPFTAEHSLLLKHWTCEHIIENIQICEPLIKPFLGRPLSPLLSSDPTVLSDQEFFLETLKQDIEIND